MNICEFCGGKFVPSTRGTRGMEQRFCSASCGLRGAKPRRMVTCVDCDRVFVYHGRGRCSRCAGCRAVHDRAKTSAWQRRYRIKEPGVGSGNNQWGFKNHQYKDGKHAGISGYRNLCFKRYPKACILCGKTTGVIDAHHIDGDRKNVAKPNLVPLCRSHHKEVHWAIKATKKQMFDAFNTVKQRVKEKKCVQLS